MTGVHRRYNPLLDEWVLCSPRRLERPWQGESLDPSMSVRTRERVPAHDPGCYLCPGNVRSSGALNPDYRGVYVFDNDHPALVPGSGPAPSSGDAPAGSPLLRSAPERGRCRVICFSPRHDTHFADLAPDALLEVVDVWASESERLRRDEQAAHVQVFENRGAAMGASNPHPHGQIWASGQVPSLPARKAQCLSRYAETHGRDLLGDYLAEELKRRERLVVEGERWVQLVPYWAVWPFETMLVPRRPVARLSELDGNERRELASLLSAATGRYDSLFDVAFPYSFGWSERPDGAGSGFRLHGSYFPPLLRSATVRKFLVGYELTAEPQRDFLPEEAAERLRGALEGAGS